MKAWRATTSHVFNEPIDSIVAADSRSKARFAIWNSSTEVGFTCKFAWIRVRRAKEYDEWAKSQTKSRAVSEDYFKMEICK